MKQGFRHAMSWLHTWGGLWFAWVLFAIFFTGTLGVFDDAISHWMRDRGRAAATVPSTGAERAQAVAMAQAYLEQQAPAGEFWSIGLPSEEDSSLRVFWQQGEDGPFEQRLLDPLSGAELAPGHERRTEGGHHFVHMHFEFHAGMAGIWLVGIATMAMLVALVSGIVVHKKIFVDFFTFRPGKGQRSWLDGHNALAVLTLPFQFMIAYTGLVVFWFTYMPAAIEARFGGERDAYFSTLFEGPAPRPMRHLAASVAALAPLMQQAEAAIGREASFVVVNHPGDASAAVRVFGRFDPAAEMDRLVGRGSGQVQFDGVNGDLLHVQMPDTVRGGPVLATQQTMNALHFVRFGGYTMKWLYFICGMAGAAMMASGAILFAVKRLKNGAAEFGTASARVYGAIEALNVAAIAGLLLACIAYLWFNRLLPLDWENRAAWEVRLFFLVWAGSLGHAAWRPPRSAWREQLGVAAFLCLGLPGLNWLVTGDHFAAALARGDAMTAGVELVAIACGVLLLAAARMIGRRAAGDVAGGLRRAAGRAEAEGA